jgi:hypothetical protein
MQNDYLGSSLLEEKKINTEYGQIKCQICSTYIYVYLRYFHQCRIFFVKYSGMDNFGFRGLDVSCAEAITTQSLYSGPVMCRKVTKSRKSRYSLNQSRAWGRSVGIHVGMFSVFKLARCYLSYPRSSRNRSLHSQHAKSFQVLKCNEKHSSRALCCFIRIISIA